MLGRSGDWFRCAGCFFCGDGCRGCSRRHLSAEPPKAGGELLRLLALAAGGLVGRSRSRGGRLPVAALPGVDLRQGGPCPEVDRRWRMLLRRIRDW